MSVDWNQYEPYVPPYRGPLAALSLAQARESFERLMAAKSHRIEHLRRLTAANAVTLGEDNTSIQRLNEWLVANVEANPDQPERLRNLWYSVVNDVALFLGDVLIDRCRGLRWDIFMDGPHDVAFQKHVIVGFRNVANPKFNLDIDRLVATHAHQAAAGDDIDRSFFVELLDSATLKA